MPDHDRLPWAINYAGVPKLFWRLIFGNPNKAKRLCIFRREAFLELCYRWDRLNRWWRSKPEVWKGCA